MSEEFQQLTIYIGNGINEYYSLNWGYGKLTIHLKIMYLNNLFEDILKYLSGACIILNKEELLTITLIHKINDIGKIIKENIINNISTNIIKINIFKHKLIKYNLFNLFRNIDHEDKQEYEDLVKECNPVYTILVNKYKTNNLNIRFFPIELLRYMNEFL
jgi:hypothetical protein